MKKGKRKQKAVKVVHLEPKATYNILGVEVELPIQQIAHSKPKE